MRPPTPATAGCGPHLVTRYESGLSVGAVAKQVGINIDTVTGHLRRRGIQIRRSNHLIPATKHPELLELKAQGLSIAQIGEHFGCSRSSVQRALRRAARSRPAIALVVQVFQEPAAAPSTTDLCQGSVSPCR